MKKTLSLILTLALLLMSFATVTVSATDGVTAADTKVVSVDNTQLTLAEFIAAAATNDYSGQTLTLLCDIVLAGNTTIPAFKGTLDGNGKTISGLTKPLFAKLNGAKVKNLTLGGEISENGTLCGALANEVEGTVLISNCVNNANVTFVASTTGIRLGGMIGSVNGGSKLTMTGCVNNGNINASSATMPMGSNNKPIEYGGGTGGIIGVAGVNASNKAEILLSDCANNGNVTVCYYDAEKSAAATAVTGGILGWCYGDANFTRCLNNGEVKVTSPVVHGGTKVGGFSGVLDQGTATFDTCFNLGSVTAGRYAGGFVGQCYLFNMTDCYNYGDITSGGYSSSDQNSYAGGLVAFLSNSNITTSSSITNSANYGAINANVNKSSKTDVCAGGAVAYINASGLSVTNFVGEGTVTSQCVAGGVFGWLSRDDEEFDIQDCVVMGTVGLATTTVGTSYQGAFIGYVNYGTVSYTGSAYLLTANANAYTVRGSSAVTGEAAQQYVAENVAALRAFQEISFEGLQYTAAANGKFDVRFVSSLSSLEYANAGYEVIRLVNGKIGSIDKEIKTVYKSLTGYDQTGTRQEYLATEYGAQYLAALSIKNVPAEGNVTFIVRPYLVNSGDASVIYGNAFSIEFANGTYVQ